MWGGFEDGKDVEGGSFVGDAASVGIRTLAASATDDGLLDLFEGVEDAG